MWLLSGETRSFATTLDITATIAATAGADIPVAWQGFDLLTPLSKGQESPRKVVNEPCKCFFFFLKCPRSTGIDAGLKDSGETPWMAGRNRDGVQSPRRGDTVVETLVLP